MAAQTGPFSEYAPTVAGIKSSGELSVSRPFFYAFAVSAPTTLQNGGKFSVARTLKQCGCARSEISRRLLRCRGPLRPVVVRLRLAVRGGGPEQGRQCDGCSDYGVSHERVLAELGHSQIQNRPLF
jgi:hypothetical protein